ncbi:uncharacterized protein zgc:66455 isoform X3 [Simochromis diagramma]|uniref:uncharacterized protein zgc:66455 isoform X3 n=1 Tax=Simochromis diagramma TaxID=43689 RepID=UPI001A7E43F6|nr:uncharacterized protein zgc:66455 isoform X3 [Simochromis diagramma]
MKQTAVINFKCVLLIFLLTFDCNAQVNEEDTEQPPEDSGAENTFFALRSCHRLLYSDSGEFFSPDYLCSNPPLWCNWTIQVDPSKRIHLYLEDLTPDDICNLKQDQIHIDEPVGDLAGHKVLQKCWQEAKYTSSSNILYVVLLISGWPNPLYRGFYGRYQAFGSPVIYNPGEGFTETSNESETSPGLMDFSESGPGTKREQMGYGYDEEQLARMTELPTEPKMPADTNTWVDENNPLSLSGNYTTMPTASVSTQRTFRSGRGITHTQLEVTTDTTTAKQMNEEESTVAEDETTTLSWTVKENITEVSQTSVQLSPSSDRQEIQHADHTHPQPNMVEPLSDHRANSNMKNDSEIQHFPGDHLFEVAIEINFSQDLLKSWDNLARSLLLSISKQLEALHAQLSVSSKRMKRLHAGVLYILWLQVRQGPRGMHVHRGIHSALQGLIEVDASGKGNLRKAIIMSVSTADVNECGTQLVQCDFNADCVNQFGSYSCHCRAGFQDNSRLGSGGTICVDMKATGCSSRLSTEAKGVYILFFLLSSLILALLVVAGMFYHRHHRGKFLVRCHSNSSLSPSDPNNNHQHPEENYSNPADSDPPPPSPPAWGPRECWGHVKEQRQVVDLQLLRFNLLHPPDSYMDQREGVNSQ